jgi:acyl-coenzyme A synthetase/AMP-(fatty) acid ligase
VRIGIGEAVDGWDDIRESRAFEPDFPCADVGLDDPAILYYTSGSSGQPKGVTHPSRSLFAWRVCSAYWHSLEHTDTMWCTADTGWSKAGTGILFGPWSRGASVFFYNGRFDAQERLRFIAEYGVTVFCAAATEFRHLIHLSPEHFALPRLRLAVSAGESVNPEVVNKWRELTHTQLLDGYGQTETLMTIHNYPCMPLKPGSMGKPLPGTSAEIITEEGEIAPVGVTGQLAIKLPHPTFMLGYWNDPQRTKAGVIQVGDDEYWATGDLCYRDADGYFFYAGRNDDIISSAGYRIGPTEVENALIEHPAVAESAVVASPDDERGEVVKAYIVLNEGHVPSSELVKALQLHVQQTTAPYKYPRKIEFVEELPKGPTGKLLRRVLREREFTSASGAVTG